MLVRFTYVVSAALALIVGHHSSVVDIDRLSTFGIDRPECPDHVFTPWYKGKPLRPITIPLVDAGTNIPEFNDCQALVENKAYGPVVAIFARQRPLPPVLSSSQYYLVAVIFNYGKLGDPYVSYAPLSINSAYSCLYLPLGKLPIAGARLEHNGDNPTCSDSIPAYTVPNLQARVWSRRPSESVPRAARWDWDHARAEHYIGVACGIEWCEVGRNGFTSAADPWTGWVTTLIPRMPPTAVHRVPGYFDEQELAIENRNTKGEIDPLNPLKPSEARATFFPAPKLQGVVDFDEYRYVGTMVVSKTLSEYQAKFGLVAGTPTHLYLKRRPWWYWGGFGKNYLAKFETGTTVINIPIKRRAHSEMSVPPMVRWRWIWEDETTWIRCLEGCCSTQ